MQMPATTVIADVKKARNLTTRLLHFLNVAATFRIWHKQPVSQICVVSFSIFGSWIRFELHCSFLSTPSLLLFRFTKNFASSGL